MQNDIKELEKIIGYQFKDERLIVHAMSHSSYANEKQWDKSFSNERLEFLGDAVLELVPSEFLFCNNEKLPEGKLTKLRASMVCEPSLAFSAREFGMEKYILLGKGEEITGGRSRDSIVSDALEALIGAIYLDGGYKCAQDFILKFVLNDLDHKQLFFDSKTMLQEIVQAGKDDKISYHLIKESGPDHNKIFEVEVCIGDTTFGSGVGKTKKSAEQNAAYKALLKLKNMEDRGK